MTRTTATALVAAIWLLLATVPDTYARSARDFFADEPGTLFPLLTRSARLDMLDYFESGQQVEQENNLGGTSRIEALDPLYLRVTTSRVRTVELRLIPYGRKDTIVAVIETVNTPMPVSRLVFFNAHWVPLRTICPLAMPVTADFLLPGLSRQQRDDALARVPFEVISLAFDGNNHDTIIATQQLPALLGDTDYAPLRPYLRTTLRYRLQGKKFKPVNEP